LAFSRRRFVSAKVQFTGWMEGVEMARLSDRSDKCENFARRRGDRVNASADLKAQVTGLPDRSVWSSDGRFSSAAFGPNVREERKFGA
jgi:hypothetical protein